MKKAAVVFSAAAVMAMMAVSVPTPAEARGGWGWGPGIAGGLLAGALIGGLASSAYGYGPGYGYYGPGYGYYGGYAPVTTAPMRPHIMDMDMADHTTDGLILCISPGLLPSLLRFACLQNSALTNLPKSRSKIFGLWHQPDMPGRSDDVR